MCFSLLNQLFVAAVMQSLLAHLNTVAETNRNKMLTNVSLLLIYNH